jgi:hypothetical protein
MVILGLQLAADTWMFDSASRLVHSLDASDVHFEADALGAARRVLGRDFISLGIIRLESRKSIGVTLS